MKRVAICISGLPRNLEVGFQNILESIIKPNNNPDVFIHTWIGDDDNLKNKVIELYNPKLVSFEPRKVFVNDNMELDRMMVSHGRSYTRENFVDMVYSSWYSIQAANNLKEQYRLANGIAYDYIIRARFDIQYNLKIDCASFDNNIIYVCNRQLPDHDMVDDRFAFGSNHNMNIYASGFFWIDYMCKLRDTKDGVICGETLVYEMLTMANIKNNAIGNLICDRLHS